MGMDRGLYGAIDSASAVLGISLEEGLSEEETSRIKSYLRVHYGMNWNGTLGGNGEPWAEIASIRGWS